MQIIFVDDFTEKPLSRGFLRWNMQISSFFVHIINYCPYAAFDWPIRGQTRFLKVAIEISQ